MSWPNVVAMNVTQIRTDFLDQRLKLFSGTRGRWELGLAQGDKLTAPAGIITVSKNLQVVSEPDCQAIWVPCGHKGPKLGKCRSDSEVITDNLGLTYANAQNILLSALYYGNYVVHDTPEAKWRFDDVWIKFTIDKKGSWSDKKNRSSSFDYYDFKFFGCQWNEFRAIYTVHHKF